MPNYGSQVRKVRTRVSGYQKRTVLARASWIDDAQMNLLTEAMIKCCTKTPA